MEAVRPGRTCARRSAMIALAPQNNCCERAPHTRLSYFLNGMYRSGMISTSCSQVYLHNHRSCAEVKIERSSHASLIVNGSDSSKPSSKKKPGKKGRKKKKGKKKKQKPNGKNRHHVRGRIGPRKRVKRRNNVKNRILREPRRRSRMVSALDSAG